MIDGPKTLLEAVGYFTNEDNCIRYLASKRWPDGAVVCPTCGGKKVSFLAVQKRWQCSNRHPKRQFSIKVGTIMEDSPIKLEKWMPVLWLVANCRNGISSWEIHRDLGVTQKTAWFMLHRVRLAMQDDLTGGTLHGEVEVDETFIGGKARNMHKARKKALKRNVGGLEGGNGKTIVLGMLERGSGKKQARVRATIIGNRKIGSMAPEIIANVAKGTEVHSDEAGQTWRMDNLYVHKIVNHLETYVNGNIHTNGIENFWSLLKRGLHGTYVAVEPFHLFRYVDEQAFRYNNRKHADGEVVSDAERFSRLCSQIVGRRLTYKELTGREGQRQEEETF